MDKINISAIVLRHIATLRDHPSGNVSIPDVATFLALPVAIAGAGIYLNWGLSVDALNAILAAFAIFAGLLLNLLVLVYTFSTDTVHPNALVKVRSTVIRQIHDNIAYSVLVSVTIVMLALIGVAHLKKGGATPEYLDRYTTSAIVFLTANFVLTLLMILKRIHVMLNSKLDQMPTRKAS